MIQKSLNVKKTYCQIITMKTIILSAFVVILISISSYAQIMVEPFKKANTIIIETNLPEGDLFKKWGKHLAQNGYSIDNSDSNFYTITTGPKNTSKFNYAFIVISSINDSGTVIIKIKWRLNSSIFTNTRKTEFYDWEYAKGRNNVQNIIYKDLIKTIKSFGSFNIKYIKN